MSTITVVRKGQEVAIAADSLTSSKYYRRESANYVANHQKIFSVGNSLLAMSGPTAAKFALRRYFANCEKLPILNSVESIYEAWLSLHQTFKNEYFLRPDENNDEDFEATHINVIIANSHGIFGVDSERCVQEYTKFFAIGSGEDYSLGALFVAYDDDSKSVEEIARIGVEAAIEFSSNFAAPILSQVLTLKSC